MADRDIEKKLRERLSKYDEMPPDDAWVKLSDALAPKTPWMIFRTISVVLLLIIGIMASLFWGWKSLRETEESLLSWSDEAAQDHSDSAEELCENKLSEGENECQPTDYIAPKDKLNLGANGSDVQVISKAEESELSEDEKISKIPAAEFRTSSPKQIELTQAVAGKWTDPSYNKASSSLSMNKTDELNNLMSNGKRSIPDTLISSYVLPSAITQRPSNTRNPDKHLLTDRKESFQNDDLSAPYFIRSLGYKSDFPAPALFDIIGVEIVQNQFGGKEDSVKTRLKNKRLNIYLQAMPTLNYNKISTNKKDQLLITDFKELSAFNSDRIGIRLETGISYQLSKRFDLMAGVLYLRQDQNITYLTDVVDSMSAIGHEKGFTLSASVSSMEHVYQLALQNIGVQLAGVYRLKSERFNMSLGMGVEFHKSLKKSQKDMFEQPDEYVLYNMFCRMEYPKNKPLRLVAQPTFNYSIDIHKSIDAPFYVNPYGFGLQLGLALKL